jgi:hypothetical protein
MMTVAAIDLMNRTVVRPHLDRSAELTSSCAQQVGSVYWRHIIVMVKLTVMISQMKSVVRNRQ